MLLSIEELIAGVQELGRFESLVQMPEKKDPGWTNFMAAGEKKGHRFVGKGVGPHEALHDLIKNMSVG